MKQLFINLFEKVASTDINDLQMAQYQSIQDDVLYRFFGSQATGVFGSDLAVGFVDATHVSIAAGVGFFYDAAQVGYVPKNRMIKVDPTFNAAITTPSPSNPRIDRICLAPNFATTATASRYVKAGGVGPIALQTVNKLKEMTYTLNVVAGTPGAVPVAPATPAGHISLATVLVATSTGIAGAGSITDTRNILSVAAANTNHYLATGTSIQSQLDALELAVSSLYRVSITGSTVLNAAAHRGRVLQVNPAAAMSLTFPSLAANDGFIVDVSDILGKFAGFPVTLIPNGTDKIQGLNSNLVLEAPWGYWRIYGDSTNGWILR